MAILQDCTDLQYWQIDAINASSLKTFINDPIEYKNRYIDKVLHFKQSDAMDFGSALHCKILEPEDFDNRFIQKPDGINLTTKPGKEWKETIGNKKIVSSDDLRLIGALSSRALDVIPFEWFTAQHAKEIALTSEYKPDIFLKSKIDWLLEFENKIINCDLKTIQSIDDRSILRNMKDFGYDIQTAFYDKVIGYNYNKPVESYLLFLAKSTGNVRLINVTNFAKNAHAKTFEAVDRLLKAKATNRWISPYADVSELEIPAWFN